MQRNVNVVEDLDGKKIVVIHDIIFKGKRTMEWTDVEAYLKRFVGEEHIIENTKDLVYIGPDLPDEYAHSNYTMLLRGANAKAKANAAQGIPEMLLIANEREYEENRKDKHSKNAKYGWYSYVTRFALPVYGENGDIERYNVFRAIMLVRHAEDNKLYLYDIMNTNKGKSNIFHYEFIIQKKNLFIR